jgi:hypothetical protein
MFTKVLHIAKMTWMFSWRLLILDAIVFKGAIDEKAILISFITATVFVVGFNKTFLTWPLVRLIRKKRVIIPANAWGSDAVVAPTEPKREPTPAAVPTTKFRSPETAATVIDGAIEKGRITGYEPSTLEALPVPATLTMTGTPGSGLNDASGMDQDNIDLGIKGEANFARALSVAGLIHRFRTIWSVPVPDRDIFKIAQYSADIDCVLATDETVFLIDLKNYKSGAVRYYHKGIQLYCEDSMTGQQVGDPKTMSRNMANATEALRKHFPKVNFTPVVVFMPTDKGEGFVDKVFWPGNIPAMNLSQFFYKLNTESDFSYDTTPHAGAFSLIASLLREKRAA